MTVEEKAYNYASKVAKNRLTALLASCKDDSHSESSNVNYNIYVDTIRGHEYIILNGMYFGDIIHSESCQCKKGGNGE